MSLDAATKLVQLVPLSRPRSPDPPSRQVEIRLPPHQGGYPALPDARTVAEYLCTYLGTVLADPREHAYLLALSSKSRLLCDPYLLSVGCDDQTLVDPRSVYRFALLTGAAQIILAHTHPSGDCRPSDVDVRMTQRITEAGVVLGITLADHLILAGCHRAPSDPVWVSLRMMGVM